MDDKDIEFETDRIKRRAEALVLTATTNAQRLGGDNATAAADLMMAFVLLTMRSGGGPKKAIEVMGDNAIAACEAFWGSDGRRLDA